MRGVFFCPSYSPPRPQKASEKKLRLENAWCFFCPLRFPTTSTRRHLEKSRREKSCAHVRGFADFYQRFFFGETPSRKRTPDTGLTSIRVAKLGNAYTGQPPSQRNRSSMLRSAYPPGGTRSYGGCRRADFGSALFRLDAPQPPRDPGVQSLPREDGWERHHEDNRRERELAFGSSRLGPLYTALGSP
jgi:hypothetical protein